MPLPVNHKAPDFTLKDDQGKPFALHRKLKGQPFILYFYPKNFTPGCTREACEFRDHFTLFRDKDIEVIGISQDTVASHQKFKKEYNLPFTLLSDGTGQVCRLYKAVIPIVGMTRRISYLVDDQMIIKAVYENMFGAEKHIDEMIRAMK